MQNRRKIMLKNITASAVTALCIAALSASAGAQGIANGVANAGEDIVNGVANAGRDIVSGVRGGTADDSGMGSEDVEPGTNASGSGDSEDPDSEGTSDTVLGETDKPNPGTGVSFGYIAGAAVLGALGVAVTVNKRRG